MKFKISLAQLHIRVGDLDSNLKNALLMIESAAQQQSQLVLLPELWSSGYDLENAHRHAQETPRILAQLQELSRQHHICIGGSLLESTPAGIYNTFAWLDPNVSEIIFYRKAHLFRLMQEDKWLQPGSALQTVQTPWGLSGLAICYDLRFPELFRHYALNGASTFILSAEWPSHRIQHWQTLLRARAIENLSFFFATNCIGPAHKDEFGGHSAVISPWGETLIEGSAFAEELLTVEIDPAQIERARGFLTVFTDRREDLY
jgi:omega-amidase